MSADCDCMAASHVSSMLLGEACLGAHGVTGDAEQKALEAPKIPGLAPAHSCAPQGAAAHRSNVAPSSASRLVRRQRQAKAVHTRRHPAEQAPLEQLSSSTVGAAETRLRQRLRGGEQLHMRHGSQQPAAACRQGRACGQSGERGGSSSTQDGDTFRS